MHIFHFIKSLQGINHIKGYNDDDSSRKSFIGRNCDLFESKSWTVQTSNSIEFNLLTFHLLYLGCVPLSFLSQFDLMVNLSQHTTGNALEEDTAHNFKNIFTALSRRSVNEEIDASRNANYVRRIHYNISH